MGYVQNPIALPYGKAYTVLRYSQGPYKNETYKLSRYMPNRHKEAAEIQLYPNSTQALKGEGWVNSDAPRPLTQGERPGNHSLPNVVLY
jgi:hypothetical protein